MKHLPVAGIVIAILALGLSTAALVAGSGGGNDLTTELATLGDSISALDERVSALNEKIGSLAEGRAKSADTLSGLRERVEKTAAEAGRLEKALSDLGDSPAAVAGLAPEKLAEIVRKEMEAAREEREKEQADRRRRGMIDWVKREINVGGEKGEKVAEVLRKMFEKMRPLWREFRDEPEGTRAKMKKLGDGAEKEVAEFLDEEELGRYQEWRKRMEQGWGGGRRGGRGGNRDNAKPREKPKEKPKPAGDDEPAAF